jgi:hypothetical protein
MKPLTVAAAICAGLMFSAAKAETLDLRNQTTGAAGSLAPSTASQHQQGQAYIEGLNGCQVSMWLDPKQIQTGSQQVQIHNCKQ